jgi:hypothetical protein
MDVPSVPPVGDVSIPTTIKDYPIDQFERPTFDPIDKETRRRLFAQLAGHQGDFSVPTLVELGFQEPQHPSPHKGGETTALKVFEEYFKDKQRVALVRSCLLSSARTNNPSLRNPTRRPLLSIQRRRPS